MPSTENLSEDFKEEIKKLITTGISDAIGPNFKEEMKLFIKTEVSIAVKTEVSIAVKTEVSIAVKNEISKALGPEFKEEMKALIRTEIQPIKDDVAVLKIISSKHSKQIAKLSEKLSCMAIIGSHASFSTLKLLEHTSFSSRSYKKSDLDPAISSLVFDSWNKATANLKSLRSERLGKKYHSCKAEEAEIDGLLFASSGKRLSGTGSMTAENLPLSGSEELYAFVGAAEVEERAGSAGSFSTVVQGQLGGYVVDTILLLESTVDSILISRQEFLKGSKQEARIRWLEVDGSYVYLPVLHAKLRQLELNTLLVLIISSKKFREQFLAELSLLEQSSREIDLESVQRIAKMNEEMVKSPFSLS